MTPAQKLRAKRRNERVKLVATFINAVAIAAFTLGFTVPMVGWFAQRTADPLVTLTKALAAWPVLFVALAFHAVAHTFLGRCGAEG